MFIRFFLVDGEKGVLLCSCDCLLLNTKLSFHVSLQRVFASFRVVLCLRVSVVMVCVCVCVNTGVWVYNTHLEHRRDDIATTNHTLRTHNPMLSQPQRTVDNYRYHKHTPRKRHNTPHTTTQK